MAMIGEGRPSNLMIAESYLLPISALSGQNQLYFQPIFFQFLPEITSDEESANYEDVAGDAIGRSEPFSMYKNGGGRRINITTTFAAVNDTYNEIWVQQQVTRCKALTKPIYDREEIFNSIATKLFAPPLVLFSYGFRYVNIPVVVTSVRAQAIEDVSISEQSALPRAVTVEFELKTNYPYGYVPGYINYLKTYVSNTNPLGLAVNIQNSFNPKEMSFGGSVSVSSTTAELLRNNSFLGVNNLTNINITEIP